MLNEEKWLRLRLQSIIFYIELLIIVGTAGGINPEI
jgi:hypothetical protein